MNKRHFLALTAAACIVVSTGPARAQSVDAAAVASQYATLVHANYGDSLAGAQDLQRAVRAFTTTPSAETLAVARKAWLEAREWYLQTESFRFYGGPIDNDGGPEGRLNAWPIDESYIDSVKGKPKAGLVNNRKAPITKASLSRANERGGEENISTGWHAIEFLLWGQDLSETGPGDRSADDYVDGKAPNADRRRQYLNTATELLVDDLGSLVKAWAPAARNYRAVFEKGGAESLRKIIVGAGSLSRGELAGQRLEVALNSRDQEDEHSCFSDNTHRDVVGDARGVENVWLGRYQRRDGTLLQGASLKDLVAKSDATLAERTSQQLAASVAAAEAIQAPFDREITGGKDGAGRQRIQKTIDSLVQQSKDLAEAAAAIGIKRLTLVKP
jgi:putative iron-regulated protein